MKVLLWKLKGIRIFGWRFAWHIVFGHPASQVVPPWCNCMGVYDAECEEPDAS